MSIILKQKDNNEILGIPSELFFSPKKNDFFQHQYLDKKLHSPIGVAAGPHTQLAQNIVVAWLTGARFIELKTIQTLNELEVSKPCIDMQDEGYNCEWSQELKIKKSFNEYLNAWILIHIINKYKIVEDKKFAITQKYQVANIADWCNECGNYTTFCSTSGNPFLDKPKIHISTQSYLDSPSGFFVFKKDNNKIVFFKKEGKNHKLVITKNFYIYGLKQDLLKLNKTDYSIIYYDLVNKNKEYILDIIVEMSIICNLF